MTLTLTCNCRHCSTSVLTGWSEKRENPEYLESRMLMVLLMHCVNSSTVVDPSKLITYSKYNQNLSPTTYTVQTYQYTSTTKTVKTYHIQQKQSKLIIYNKYIYIQNLLHTTSKQFLSHSYQSSVFLKTSTGITTLKSE